MRPHCLLIIALWLNHACGVYYNYPGVEIPVEEHHDRPNYEFEYGVRDPSTGDLKKQWEVRKGDNVRGAYSLLEPDGTVRTVRYSADKHRGFNAVVTREGKSEHFRPFSLPPTHHRTTDRLSKHPNFHLSNRDLSQKPVYYSSRQNAYQDSESTHSPQYAAPEVPPNHNPVYTGVSNYNKLVDMYKTFREKNSDTKRHKFDYGINEYFANGFEALNRLSSRWRDIHHSDFTPEGFV